MFSGDGTPSAFGHRFTGVNQVKNEVKEGSKVDAAASEKDSTPSEEGSLPGTYACTTYNMTKL